MASIPSVVDPPLPSHLSRFARGGLNDLDGDEFNAAVAEAWKYFVPTLKRAGFTMHFGGKELAMGCRRSSLWPPAKNPFKPEPYECFEGYFVIYPPFSSVESPGISWVVCFSAAF